MNLKGTVSIDAPQDQVWSFLTDPHAVGGCAPGLETLEILVPDEKFRAVASIGFGTVKVTFTADIEWLELDEPNRAKMKAHGDAPGSSMDATSELMLSGGENGSTTLDWTADVVVVGKIASLASRLMGGVTQRLAGEFFKCVKSHIEK